MDSDQVPAPLRSPFRADTRAKMENVFAALCTLPSNGRTVTASLREIQKLTGQGRGTVAKALQRLCEERRIEATGNARTANWGRAAHSYRILRPHASDPSFLWTKFGLGVTARLIYEAMPKSTWIPVREVSQAAEVSARTAQKYLIRLLSAGLVDCGAGGTWFKFDDDEYLAWYENWLVGSVKKSAQRQLTQQQCEWKAITDSASPRVFQGGQSGDNGPSRLPLLGPHGSPSAEPQSEADGHSQSA